MRNSIIIAGLGLALFGGAALAFGPRGGDGPAHIERLADQLEVSAEQRTALREVVDTSRPQSRELMDRARANRRAFQALDPLAEDYSSRVEALAVEHGEISAQMLRLRAGQRAEIQAILTEEQRQQAARLREGQRPRGGRDPGVHRRH